MDPDLDPKLQKVNEGEGELKFGGKKHFSIVTCCD